MQRRSPRRTGERGSLTLELVIWVPALLLIVSAVVLAGRVAQARLAVEGAAAEAARAATAASSSTSAQALAREAAAASLSSAGLRCTGATVSLDTSQWSLPPGLPAWASATVVCTVPVADLALPGVGGSRTIQATSTSALDRFRVRG